MPSILSLFGKTQIIEPTVTDENDTIKPINRPLEQLKANVYGKSLTSKLVFFQTKSLKS